MRESKNGREGIWWDEGVEEGGKTEREMAREGRAKWGGFGLSSGQFSYKRITLIVCSVNIVVALYILRSLYSSLYIYSNNDNGKFLSASPHFFVLINFLSISVLIFWGCFVFCSCKVYTRSD